VVAGIVDGARRTAERNGDRVVGEDLAGSNWPAGKVEDFAAHLLVVSFWHGEVPGGGATVRCSGGVGSREEGEREKRRREGTGEELGFQGAARGD
jgi:hypothetical protein